jgi:DNA-directed RNA polymerase specialized sigma24 family protein
LTAASHWGYEARGTPLATESIIATRAGSKRKEVFRAHQACVLKAGDRETGSPTADEGMAQSVLPRLARGSIDDGRISNPECGLHRSMVNATLEFTRARGRRETVPVEATDELPFNPSLLAERSRSSSEIRIWLRRELAQLTPHAEMFALSYAERKDNPEIKEVMNMSEIVVIVILHRTRVRLKKDICSFMKGSS